MTNAPPTTHEITESASADVLDSMERFGRFLEHIQVQNDDGRYGPFVPFPGQRRMLRRLLAGDWLWVLKARRTGITTVAIAFGCWILATGADRTVTITAMTDDKAMGIMRMLKNMLARLPYHLRPRVVGQSQHHMELGNGSRVIVEVGTANAGRSERIDYAIVDEACFVGRLVEVLKGLEPAVDRAGGLIVVVSTVNSPDTPGVALSFDEFRAGWDAAEDGRSAYKPLFVSCFELPGQDQAWYDRTAAQHAHQQGFMAKEHPRNPIECWETIEGLVYQLVRERHFVRCERPAHAELYRSVDPGQSVEHPSVCVWGWHDPESNPRLTFDPDCDIIRVGPSAKGRYAEGSEQFFAYGRGAGGVRRKMHDDAPDAVRMMATHFRMTGHLHIIRILSWRCGTRDFPPDPMGFFHEVLELGGLICVDPARNEWIAPPDSENYAGSIMDRSATGIRAMINATNVPWGFGGNFQAHVKPEQFVRDEVEQGIAWVQALIAGSDMPWRMEEYRTPEERRIARIMAKQQVPGQSDVATICQQHVLGGRLNKGNSRRIW